MGQAREHRTYLISIIPEDNFQRTTRRPDAITYTDIPTIYTLHCLFNSIRITPRIALDATQLFPESFFLPNAYYKSKPIFNTAKIDYKMSDENLC